MKKHFLKAKHWLLLAILGMIGFTSCSKDNEGDEIHLMYGVPETTFNPDN